MTSIDTLADVLGITSTVRMNRDYGVSYVTMDVKQNGNSIGSVTYKPLADFMNGVYRGQPLFSFDISDGQNLATVELTYDDVVNFAAFTPNGGDAATCFVKTSSGSTILFNTSAGTVEIQAAQNNLSVLANKINDVAQTNSLGLEASYNSSTGEFKISSGSENPIINVGSVDVVSHLNLV